MFNSYDIGKKYKHCQMTWAKIKIQQLMLHRGTESIRIGMYVACCKTCLYKKLQSIIIVIIRNNMI